MTETQKEIDGCIERWVSQCDPGGVLCAQGKQTDGLNVRTAGQGVLSLGLPAKHFRGNILSHRMWWFPQGIPDGLAVALVSSRIGKRPDKKPYLFDAIRTVGGRLVHQSKFLINHAGTATAPYVASMAELFELPIMEFLPMPVELDSDWFAQEMQRDSGQFVGYYDPRFDALEPMKDPDGLVVGSALELFLMSLRLKGNIARSVHRRLNEDRAGETLTHYLANSQAIPSESAKQLQAMGAIPWYLYAQYDEDESLRPIKKTVSIVPLQQFEQHHELNQYLAHWTRERHGPWPNESNKGFIENLILGVAPSRHGKYMALARILASGRLIASNRITRDSTPVVCMTARTVDEFPERRVFRPHLSRWDFEGVGIAVKRDMVVALGGQPVVYGDDEDWEQKNHQARPFFQKCSESGVDWHVEQEWRVVGDLNLNQLRPEDAFVFVDDLAEGRKIAALSRWPVVLLNSKV